MARFQRPTAAALDNQLPPPAIGPLAVGLVSACRPCRCPSERSRTPLQSPTAAPDREREKRAAAARGDLGGRQAAACPFAMSCTRRPHRHRHRQLPRALGVWPSASPSARSVEAVECQQRLQRQGRMAVAALPLAVRPSPRRVAAALSDRPGRGRATSPRVSTRRCARGEATIRMDR